MISRERVAGATRSDTTAAERLRQQMAEIAAMTEEQTAASYLRRQLDALADWLVKDSWTVDEAACLLVGVLPSPENEPGKFGAWLPGCKTMQPLIAGQRVPNPGGLPYPVGLEGIWTKSRLSEIDRMRKLLDRWPARAFNSSKELLLFAKKRKILPPWLPYAVQDERLRKMLHQQLVGAVELIGERVEESYQQRGAYTRIRNKYPNRFPQLKDVYELHFASKTPREISEFLSAKYDDAVGQQTIYKYINQFEDGETPESMTR